MQTRTLSEPEFKTTFAAPMRDVVATATNVLNIWPYVEAIPTADLASNAIIHGSVEHVYRNATSTFDHVLVPTRTKNVFLVVVWISPAAPSLATAYWT